MSTSYLVFALFSYIGNVQVESEPLTQFGVALASVPDRDGDGVPDLLVGDPWFPDELGQMGCIYACSSKDGRILEYKCGSERWARFGGGIVTIGDVDRDGYPDLLVSQGVHGQRVHKTWLVSGRTLVVLREHSVLSTESRLGAASAALPDINGDSVPDYIIADPSKCRAPNLSGTVTAFSGRDGCQLWSTPGSFAGEGFGAAIAIVEDASGDGVQDVVVGTDHGWADPNELRWRLSILSGVDGVVLTSRMATESEPRLGKLICSIKGPSEQQSGSLFTPVDGLTPAGILRTVAIIDPKTLKSHARTAPSLGLGTAPSDLYSPRNCRDTLSACVPIGDLNGDGTCDAALSDSECSQVWIMSGKDASVLTAHSFGTMQVGCSLQILPGQPDNCQLIAIGVGSLHGPTEVSRVLVTELPSWRVRYQVEGANVLTAARLSCK